MGSLWRNREFRRYLALSLLPGLILLPLCFWLHRAAGAVCTLLYGLELLLFCLYTWRRYRQIAGLSDQLTKISGGNYNIEIGEYTEGELSILSSEILKITTSLSHQAEYSRRDKALFADSLADISHQLKTPLTSMSMLADLLGTPGLSADKRREFLQGMRASLDRTGWLVASLLKLSRLDAGAVEFHMQAASLKDMIGKAAAPLLVPIELQGQTLTRDVDEALILATDPFWLAEAVGNLIKNCMEHTPPGGRIEVRCSQNALYTEIRIRDDGPGFPAADLPHIFERFYRGENASSDSVGIGLALSKSIVQNLGGSLTAQNHPEGGALFLVRLYGKTVV